MESVAMDIEKKLQILSDASRYDLSCACGTKPDDHRKRTPEGVWLYPTSLPNGGTSIMLKTLMSNVCTNDCRYCPFRNDQDPRRVTLSPEEVARCFMGYVRRKKIVGLFLSSGVIGTPDSTMARMAAVGSILRRKYRYRGFVHMKIIPGASQAAIDEILSLSSAVSLNVEVPTAAAMKQLSARKDFQRDIVDPIHRISKLTSRGERFAGVRQSTQFIVGAADESDTQIVHAAYGLYKRLKINRVYYSAYQRGLGDAKLPGESHAPISPGDALTREHRLYQSDWLVRKYGFKDSEIPFGPDGNLSLQADPKEVWARRHPEFFPLDVNRADKFELLRVPGLGHISVERILKLRTNGQRINRMSNIGTSGKRLDKAKRYLKL
jgi:predicted DNA-binding helix-hairpin-helix protein